MPSPAPVPLRRRSSARPTLANDDGWVIVPVIALLVIALGIGLALLAVVDRQTEAAGRQRVADSSQTLAEGVAAAATAVLAADGSATTWRTTGACETPISGDLTTAPTKPTNPASATYAHDLLAWRVATEVQRRFKAPPVAAGTTTANDYSTTAAGATTWRADLCPVLGTASGAAWTTDGETRWQPSFLTRTIHPAGSASAPRQPAGVAPLQTSLWVRAQANVRSATARTDRSRAVATKITQSGATFTPSTAFALGTGVFSTDLSTTLGDEVRNGVLGRLLGTDGLIRDRDARVGIRCGLLTAVNAPDATCLAGTVAGVTSATDALGLNALTKTLLSSRTYALNSWALTDANTLNAYRNEAQRNGVWRASVAGSGDVRTKTAPTSAPECLTDDLRAKVVVIERVGTDGEGYCTLSASTPQTAAARIVVVAHGGVRITGPFTGVVYAANLQECGTDDSCTAAERRNAQTREVLRVEGPNGHVTGATWADGARGATGLYPALSNPNATPLLTLGGTDGICSLPVLGPVLDAVGTTISGVLTGLLGTVGSLATSYEYYSDPPNTPAGRCALFKATLGNLTTSQLLSLFGSSNGTVTQTITTKRRQCRVKGTTILGTAYDDPGVILAGTCTVGLRVGGTAYWTTPETVSTRDVVATLSDPTLLTKFLALPNAVNDVVGLLTGFLTNYSAVTLSPTTVQAAQIRVPTGAGAVKTTFRNVPPV